MITKRGFLSGSLFFNWQKMLRKTVRKDSRHGKTLTKGQVLFIIVAKRGFDKLDNILQFKQTLFYCLDLTKG